MKPMTIAKHTYKICGTLSHLPTAIIMEFSYGTYLARESMCLCVHVHVDVTIIMCILNNFF